MSLREERALEALVTRLLTIEGVQVRVDPEDEHGDLLTVDSDCVDVLTSTTQINGAPNRHLHPTLKRVTLRGLTLAPQAEPDPDTALNRAMQNLRVGYALLGRILRAAWPTGTDTPYQDDLDGAAKSFTWQSHDVFTREDGGKTVAVYVDADIELLLHLNDPDK